MYFVECYIYFFCKMCHISWYLCTPPPNSFFCNTFPSPYNFWYFLNSNFSLFDNTLGTGNIFIQCSCIFFSPRLIFTSPLRGAILCQCFDPDFFSWSTSTCFTSNYPPLAFPILIYFCPGYLPSVIRWLWVAGWRVEAKRRIHVTVTCLMRQFFIIYVWKGLLCVYPGGNSPWRRIGLERRERLSADDTGAAVAASSFAAVAAVKPAAAVLTAAQPVGT